jgi:CDP-paratose 2-epimerase
MKILVTGGCGFIGTNICLEARKRNYKVIAFDSFARKGTEENAEVLEKAGVKIFRGDIRNAQDINRLANEYGTFDGIIHLAANPAVPVSIKYPMYDFEVNTLGTLHILNFSRANGKCPIIFASTSKVYSDIMNELPMVEKKTRYQWSNKAITDPEKKIALSGWSEKGIKEYYHTDGFGKYPHSPYGVSKLAADLYCQEYFHLYDVPTVINRMSCIYGYFQKGVEDQGWIDWFIRAIAFGDRKIAVYGNGKQVRDMLWAEDLAVLYIDQLEQIEKIKGNIFNVSGGVDNTFSLLEAIAEIEKISGKKAKIEYKDWRPADQRIYISDIEKVTKMLKWKPAVTPSEGVKRMFERYKTQS